MDVAWLQFHKLIAKINNAVETLSQPAPIVPISAFDNIPEPLIPTHASPEVKRARQTVVETTTQLQYMLRDPADLIQQLAYQTQLLASLQWLGDFQVLACIPLTQGVPLEDVAQLAGVPREQLVRVVRITAFAGVLCELDSGQVAHSALSAQLVLKPSMLDAIMFMSETAAPTALHMVMATREHGDSQQPNKSAYNIAFKNSPPFATVCEQRTKLRRQMAAFDRLGMVAANDNVTDLLSSLDWAALGNATVVEVGARSIKTVSTLAELFPSLRFVVQVCENGLNGHIPTVSSSSQQSVQETSSTLPSAATLVATMPIDKQVHVNSRIIIQQRTPGTPQIAGGAAIYILRLPVPSPTSQQDQILSRINVELRVHLDVLRASPTSMLIVVARLLPEPKTVDPSVEAVARSRDMLLHQLSNQRELGMQELVNIVNNVRDSVGRLVMIKKLIDHHSPIVALEVRFQAHPDYLVSGTNFGLWSSQSIGQEPNS